MLITTSEMRYLHLKAVVVFCSYLHFHVMLCQKQSQSHQTPVGSESGTEMVVALRSKAAVFSLD